MEGMNHKLLAVFTLAAAALIGIALASDPALAKSRQEVRDIIVEEAEGSAVPASLALAVAKTESDFQDDYEGPTGARGVMQILPRTAAEYGIDAEDLWDARRNVRLGVRMIEDLIGAFDGRWDVALARYATGRPEKAPRHGTASAAVSAYVGTVLRLERRFAEEMIAGNEVARRKREVLFADAGEQLAVAPDGRYVSADRADDQRPEIRRPGRRYVRRYVRWDEDRTPRPRVVRRLVRMDDFGGDIEARRRIARRYLDDFSGGPVVRRVPRYR